MLGVPPCAEIILARLATPMLSELLLCALLPGGSGANLTLVPPAEYALSRDELVKIELPPGERARSGAARVEDDEAPFVGGRSTAREGRSGESASCCGVCSGETERDRRPWCWYGTSGRGGDDEYAPSADAK